MYTHLSLYIHIHIYIYMYVYISGRSIEIQTHVFLSSSARRNCRDPAPPVSMFNPFEMVVSNVSTD